MGFWKRKKFFPLAGNMAEASSRAGRYGFGIEAKNAAAALRALADVVETGGAAMQEVTHSTTATVDNFVMHEATIKFAVKRP